ncbi:polysaccharide deacetylase [Dictyocaulus viviparus]|uniref:Polysaccharide deacetylase n=1 Tax=Dictyocaulus viviparus TaxID=29172 RepID=A0A0D8XDE7_DICVI|nr:polysaccharide deacetylase [Dictyocaulus viviparus]
MCTFHVNRLTTRKLRYGEFCDSGKDKCTFGAECIDSVCKCGPGFALSTNGLCERFDFHLDGKSGTTILYISKNSTNTTISPSHTYLNSNTTKAKQSSFVTKPRQNDTQVPTVSLQPKVVRHRFLGTKCRGSDVCINGGECQFGICQCPGGLFPRNGKCLRADQLPRVKPNDSCENGELCTGGSICDNDSKICICATGHLAIGDRCSRKDAPPFSGPGELCLKGEICSGGSFCLAGICQCDSEHYIDDGYCRHIASKSSPIQQLPDSALQFDRRMVKPRAPALLCNETTCRLPNCFCSISGRKPPGQLSPNNTPQFVVLTFDDAVNERTLPDYMEIFEKAKYRACFEKIQLLRNPNGCPIKGTFFISHEWTDYDAVEWLFHQGMEIAANSMSHVSLERSSALRWLNEMEGQRRVMARFASVNEEDVIGMRAPQLALGGDEQFEMMAQASFVYDNSISVDPGVNGEPFWPQTMDHSAPWQCHNAQCPARSFPGIWEIPLNQFYGSYVPQIQNFRRSSMIRAAVDLNITVDQLTMLLLSNFERSYLRNRAPYILSLNADLLQLNGKNTGMEALQRFLEELQYKKDVYVVTLKQLLQWMRDPVPIDQISQADSLNCEQTITSKHPTINRRPCAKPNKCVYFTPGLSSREHWFRTCSPCPYQYPWINNTIGVATL